MSVETWKLIGLTFTAACFYARLEFAMAQLRKDWKRELDQLHIDVNNIGGIVRRNDSKQERRNKQMLSALIDAHTKEPSSVKRFSSLLKDDSWSD